MRDQLIKQLRKEVGDLNVRAAVDIPLVETITTGSATLDFALRVGGIPRGSLCELFGKPTLGKTTLSYYMIAAEQKLGKVCVFINLEGQFSAEWARECAGVDLDQLILVEPKHGEDAAKALAKICDFVDANGNSPGLVVLDSIGAMMSEAEAEPDGTDRVGGQAKMITGMVKRVLPLARKNGVTVVFLNQVRDVMSYNPHGALKTPGGWALEHGCEVRIELRPTSGGIVLDDVNKQKKEVGKRVTAKVVKCKYSSPGAYGEYTLYHDAKSDKVKKVGIDQDREILDLALSQDVIARHGAYYHYKFFPVDSGGDTKIKSVDGVIDFVTRNPEIIAKLREDLMNVARGES